MAGNINFKFPLRSYRRGFFEGNTTTIDAVRENIKTLLLTKKGERLISTGVGTNIPILLGQMFEQINLQEMQVRVSSEIRAAIDEWMPEVTLTFIKVYDETNIEPGIGTLNKNQILIRMNYLLNSGSLVVEDSIQLKV